MPRASHLRRVPSPPSSRAPAGTQGAAVTRAEVRSVGEAGALVVCRAGEREPVPARAAFLPGWQAAPGDQVLTAEVDGETIVTSVLTATRPAALALGDGTTVRLESGGMQLVDADGRILVHYRDGHAEVAAPRGDLHLRAPTGRVHIEAATDVRIEATRDLVATGGRSSEMSVEGATGELAPRVRVERGRVAVSAPELRADARSARLHAQAAAAVVRELATAADRIVTRATTIETTADKAVVRARTLVQQVSGLLETKAGRVRSLIEGAWSLRSTTTSLRSTDDTSIDGKRVLLG